MSTTALEKRSRPRSAVKAVATYFHFTSLSTRTCDITVLNSSSEGLYFESRHPLKPGQCICIRMKRIIDKVHGAVADCGLKSLALAQVRWCEMKPDGFGSVYRIGAKYVLPG